MARLLRIYSETLPYEVVTRPRTLALLRRHHLEIVLAVRPWQLAELPSTALALRDAGIPLSLWPMLGDDEGRWASAHNARAFVDFVRQAIDGLALAGVPPRDVLLDLEPPFAQARALTAAGSPWGAPFKLFAARDAREARKEFASAAAELARAVVELHARGIETSSAVWPLIALDSPDECGWQALLGTPVDALGTGRVSVMMYTSILEGWSRGAIRRQDASALLGAAASRAVRRWGDRAGISLGCIGTGAFEDEPTYRDPSELAEDAALARAAGCDDLSLFDLGGVLAREPAEEWLDAFAIGPLAFSAQESRRVDAARRVARLLTWALAQRRPR